MQHATYVLECHQTRARHITKLTSKIDFLKGVQSARKLTVNEELQLHGLLNARYRLKLMPATTITNSERQNLERQAAYQGEPLSNIIEAQPA